MAFTSVKNKKKTISAAAAVFMSSKTVALIIIITMALMTVMLIIEGGGSGGGGPRLFASAKPITSLKVPKWPTSGRGPLQGPAPLPAPPTLAPLLKNGEMLELLAPALPLLCPPEQDPQAFSPDLNFKVNRALEKAMAAERRRKCELLKEKKEKEKDVDVVDIISGGGDDDEDQDQDQDFEYYQLDTKDQKNQTYQDQDQDQVQKLPQASAQKQLPYFPTYYRTDKPKPKAKEPQEPDVEHLRPPFYHHPSFIAVAASALIIGLYHLITKWEQVWTFCYECVNDPDAMSPEEEAAAEAERLEMEVRRTQSLPGGGRRHHSGSGSGSGSGTRVLRVDSPAAQAFIGNPRRAQVTSV